MKNIVITSLMVGIVFCAFVFTASAVLGAVADSYILVVHENDPNADNVTAAARQLESVSGRSVEISTTSDEYTQTTFAARYPADTSGIGATDTLATGSNVLDIINFESQRIQDSNPEELPSGLGRFEFSSPNVFSPTSSSDRRGETTPKSFLEGLGVAQGIDTGLNQEITPAQVIQNIINVVLTLMGVIATGIFIIGGAMYITSAGEEDKAARAKKLILYAIVGLLIIGVSAIAVNVIINTLFSPS